MPPSPSPRRSPKETFHKRGHSFGSILPAKPKDDELLLFTDMQKHERDGFLLEPAEDFDESISKFSYFRDLKLGGHIATRGENCDFLNVDGDRNDYDWLLTPPETPLFRSLDDEEDHRIGLARRGRAQIKPVSISRSSTMENARRSNRSSASPSRLSPSPRSSNSTTFTRTRSSNSSSRCSPPLVLQPSTPSRRSLTPLASKTLTPPRRSPSPASRRMSTGSSGPMLNGKRGSSPVKSNQRSSSPKLQGWQSSDPGFSFEAPPNLRTSLSDRPVSRSRGGSPSSFSGLEMGWRGRRQSMSPTPSRRASSSHSNDRDRFSSYSKASATSSAEDDLESMQSVPISYSSSPAVRKNLTAMKTRTMTSSKKLSKSFSPSSAPKRSFDSAVWLMDHRKAPQNMFRPLLSSVPSTTFGAGKGNDVQQPMSLHNSSLTISSNTSSEHGTTLGPCIDNDEERHDVISECEAANSSITHEASNCLQCNFSTTRSGPESPNTVKSAESTKQDFGIGRSIGGQTSCNVADSSEVEHGKIATCSRCGVLFNGMNVDREVGYCEECTLMDEDCFADTKIQILEELHQQDHNITNPKPCIASEVPRVIPCCSEDIKDVCLNNQLVNDEPQGDCLQRCLPSQPTVGTTEEMLLRQDVENISENVRPSHQFTVSDCQQAEPTSVIDYGVLRDQSGSHHNEIPQCLPESVSDTEFVSNTSMVDDSHKLESVGHRNLKTEKTTGIPLLLLQKSSSNKWPVVEGRTIAASNILCSEPCYARDNVSIPKCIDGRGSSSASSSKDQGSSRQSDVHYCPRDNISLLKCTIGQGSSSAASSTDQASSMRSDIQLERLKAPISSTMSSQSITSISDISTSNCSVSLCPRSDAVADNGFPTDNSESSTSRTRVCTEELDASCKYNRSSAIECWSEAQAIVNDDSEPFGDAALHNQCARQMSHEDNLSACLCSSDSEMCGNIPLSLAAEESYIQNAEEGTSVTTPEHAKDDCGINNYQMQYEAAMVSSEENKLDDCCVSTISKEDVLISATKSIEMELPGDDESPVTVEGSREQTQRCFTLEEATDTILFCSSIVHGIAYRAATIGLEHEQQSELGIPRPTVTMVGKSIPKGDSSLKLPHRRIPRHRKKSEGGTITDTGNMEVVAKDPVPVRLVPELSRTSDSMKPPKLESKCNCAIM
ncbi:hypothetical protein EJB05_02975 [Eragrostis curvula]|uniref:Uncharacterized protein n=1 Tax=Eragrostis curvula TaxID=38414 RepID=A0A5J9WWU8_9POAL|nr:hypothetical protein EJB05_02975 [Eragrostis curvula]